MGRVFWIKRWKFARSLNVLPGLLVIILIGLFYLPAYGAQGGWRSQQGPDKEFSVETPPVPGIPYGKPAQESTSNLPPEVKEIDEKVRKDAEVIMRVTPGAVPSQPDRKEKTSPGDAQVGGTSIKEARESAGSEMGRTSVSPLSGTVSGATQAGGQTDIQQKGASVSDQQPLQSKVVGSGDSGEVPKDMTKGGGPKTQKDSATTVVETGKGQMPTAREQGSEASGPSFLKRGLLVLIIIAGLFVFGRKYLFR